MTLSVSSAASAATAGDLATQADCAPPCGEINPRIMFEFPELGEEPIDLAEGESKTFEGQVYYWTDTDDEGYAPRDPSQEIVIQFSFPRLPSWAEMSVEPTEIQVPVNTCAQCFKTTADGTRPTAHFEYSEPITLTVTANEAPQATTGYDYGKLQLFAKSTESAIYNPGYGIREVRVNPGAGQAIDQQSTDDPMGVPGPGALAALAALGAAAVAVRRRA